MNTANILAATQILLALLSRADQVAQQIKLAHETGEGITDDQLNMIRANLNAARSDLSSAIVDAEEVPPATPEA